VRYAILSDIHSNLESLRAAFDLIDPADEVLCLGDIVGYGPNPNECVALIRERAKAIVLGNHDLAAIDGFGLEYFNANALAAIEWTQGVLSAQNVEWLKGWGYEFRFPGFLLVHGAPVRYFQYILDKPVAAQAFASTDAPLIFVGHTHIAEYYALRPDGSIDHKHLQRGGSVVLEPGSRYIVNVGSVGQPRDLNPLASFAFYEPDAATVTITRYPYAIADVQEKIAAAALPEPLARRLTVGR
jgi:diadenosine tetraphosphatase ApaH/serine/threonine PP2A family protein phosphatase